MISPRGNRAAAADLAQAGPTEMPALTWHVGDRSKKRLLRTRLGQQARYDAKKLKSKPQPRSTSARGSGLVEQIEASAAEGQARGEVACVRLT